MNESPDQQSDVQLPYIRKLVDENAAIVGDAVEIRKDRWVVHGVLPYAGEVPMAVFDSYEEAKRALDEILGTADQAQPTAPEDTNRGTHDESPAQRAAKGCPHQKGGGSRRQTQKCGGRSG